MEMTNMHYQNNKVINILIVDDHEITRMGVKALFESEPNLTMIGETGSFNHALQLTQQYRPDIILLELKLSDDSITERIPELLSVCPSCKILVFTESANHQTHLSALRLGAVGVFVKSKPADLLLEAIHSVYSGEVWFENSLASDLLQCYKHNVSNDIPVEPSIEKLLTKRELDIARLAIKGQPAKKIATQLFICEKTVRNQLVVIYSKLEVTSQVELVLRSQSLSLQLAK